MSRCIRNGVTYARHQNQKDPRGQMVCAACGHVKGTHTRLVVTPEAPSDIAQTPSTATVEIDVFENEGGPVTQA